MREASSKVKLADKNRSIPHNRAVISPKRFAQSQNIRRVKPPIVASQQQRVVPYELTTSRIKEL
jgi:hypothetical protein